MKMGSFLSNSVQNLLSGFFFAFPHITKPARNNAKLAVDFALGNVAVASSFMQVGMTVGHLHADVRTRRCSMTVGHTLCLLLTPHCTIFPIFLNN